MRASRRRGFARDEHVALGEELHAMRERFTRLSACADAQTGPDLPGSRTITVLQPSAPER